MYEWLAVTFRVAVISQDNSRQNCQELHWLSSTSRQSPSIYEVLGVSVNKKIKSPAEIPAGK